MPAPSTLQPTQLPFSTPPVLTEALLQFIWQFGYFNKSGLFTTGGDAVEIVHPGTPNKNQGPDFGNARIRIADTLFAGTVELHVTTSAWEKHRHATDPQYNNVVLHVVFTHDKAVNSIPVLELCNRVSVLLLETYSRFMNDGGFVACGNGIGGIKQLTWTAWKERLLAERLTRKSAAVLDTFTTANGHWEETLWRLSAKTIGGTVNGEAFEAVAKSISVNILARHKSSIHQVEALLFGQAGLLTGEFADDYPKLLVREYTFLQKKYGLVPSPVPVLFSRMRPGGFPTLRLAQLAAVIYGSSHLFSKIIDAKTAASLREVFAVTANDYWHYRFRFDEPSAYKPKTLGEDAVAGILINAVAPLLFAYGLHHGKETYKDQALRLLSELPAEENAIIKGFRQLGVRSSTAFDSQALLELKNGYCAAKRCLDCAVGNTLLREAAVSYHPSPGTDD